MAVFVTTGWALSVLAMRRRASGTRLPYRDPRPTVAIVGTTNKIRISKRLRMYGPFDITLTLSVWPMIVARYDVLINQK